MSKKFLTPINLTNLSSDPATGSEGDLYFNTTDNVVKIYADGAWTELQGGAGGGASVYYQAEAPDGAELGALWVDSDSTGTGGSSGGGSGTSLLYWTEDNNGNLIPDIDNIYSIGSSAYRVKDLYLGASSLYLQNPASASANISLSVDSSGNLKINDSKIITESNANNNLNLTNYATLQYAQSASAAAVSYLVDSAPGALDTLNELANALGDDQNFATTVTNSLASKLSISSASSTYQLKDSITSISESHNAQDNETIFVNSASSSINVTLPSSPNTGSKIKVLDVAANAQNNNITVLGNGNNIGGASAYIINTPDSSVEVMYINAIKGWNVLNEYVSLGKPGSPTGVSAVDVGTGRAYNNGAATVSFTPALDGDSATSYTVTSTPGSYTATGTSSPIVVPGLQSNTAYTFKVFATNAAGNSPESTASISITATTIPEAPTISSANADGTRARAYVYYSSGGTGGKAISSYTTTSSPSSITGSGSSPVLVSGLSAGTNYTFTMTATNANGTSQVSNTSSSITTFTATGGSITTVTSGASTYKLHDFTSTGTFRPTGTANVDIVCISGGGAGSYGSNGNLSSITGLGMSIYGTAGAAATNQSNTGRGGTSGNGFLGGTGVSASYAETGGGGGGAGGAGSNGGGSAGSGGVGLLAWANEFGNATYSYKYAGGGGGGGARDRGGASGQHGGANGSGNSGNATGSSAPSNYGGGGGGGTNGGHGGGGGKLETLTSQTVTNAQDYTVTIGSGGSGASTGGSGGSGRVLIRYEI